MTAVPPITLGSIGITYGGLTGKSKKDFGHGNGRYVTFLEVMSSARLEGRALGHVAVGPTERQNEVRRGDILFNGSSETPDEVALSTVVSFEAPAGVYLNSFCFGYRLNRSGEADATYLAYFFRSSAGRELVSVLAQGATRYNIAKTKLLRVPLELPAFEEQKQIAGALTSADDYIVSLERLIAKKRAIKQGILQDLLYARTRLPGFSGEWGMTTLGDHFEITSSKRVFQREWRGSGVPFYRARELAILGTTGAVENELFIDRSLYERYKRGFGAPEPGDFLVTAVGTLGKTYVVRPEDEFYFKDGNIIWLKASATVDSQFLKYLFQVPSLQDQIQGGSSGTTIGTYTITAAKQTIIPLVPLDEQRAIADVLVAVDAEITVLQRRLESVRQIKQGMMQELITGRTRLIHDEVAA